MWNSLKGSFIVFLLLQATFFAYGAESTHLKKLKSKFPNGLLSDDYGVLTLKDLALNTCRIKPPPFVPGTLHVYEYWICFGNKNISPTCDDEGIDDTEGHIGRVNIEARNHELTYQFFEQRPWPFKDCKSFVNDLKRIMKGTLHACISASSITNEARNERGQMERVGILHRFKTRKGCEGEECELTQEFKKEYCPELKL